MFWKGDRINEWIVENESVDPNKAWIAANGTQSLDLIGDYSGTISQSVSTTVNMDYNLSFYYAGNPDDRDHLIKNFRVLWDNEEIVTLSFDTSQTSRTQMGWQYYQTIIKANQPISKLTFEDISSYDYWAGAAIDDVKLIETISHETPVANFYAEPTLGPCPLTVQFSDTSINIPTSWNWNFGDGGTSVNQNPEYLYSTPGIYTVNLTVTNANGSDTESKNNYIAVISSEASYALPIHPGWNFISVPKTLKEGNNTPLWLDQYVDPQAHSMWGFNGETGFWVQMAADDLIIPLNGYWLWNAEQTIVPFTFKDMGQQLPPTKNLFSGWNAIGFSATVSATARDTLLSVQDDWVSTIGFVGLNQRYENAIINGGSGEFADTRLMNPGQGYWLYMNSDGTLSPLSG